MRFGKIEYLNLLPFDVFLKGYRTSNGFKSTCNYKKSYPAKLNKEFLFRRIDAGFISSIAGMKAHYKTKACKAGIIAYKEVWSVLVLESSPASDYQSATSNALCLVLDLKGAVLIGDRALKYHYDSMFANSKNSNPKRHDSMKSASTYLTHKNLSSKNSHFQNSTFKHNKQSKYYDMAKCWYDKTGLPFVFGRACFHTNDTFYKNLIQDFNHKLGQGKRYKGIKIPHYILMPYVKKIGITKTFARKYLEHIYYKLEPKEHHALTLFYRYLRLKGIKAPKRF